MSEVIDDSIIDVDEASPDLKRLAEEVEASGKPRVLRLAGRDVATINPASNLVRRKTGADVQRLLSFAGAWRDHLDPDEFNRANIASREADKDVESSSR